jgi:hypothetical protein
MLSPGFWPKMGGTVTVWALCLPEGTAWWVWRFAGMAACCASQKVTVPVFSVTSVLVLHTRSSTIHNWNLDCSLLGPFRIAPRLSKQNQPLSGHRMQNTTRVALLL